MVISQTSASGRALRPTLRQIEEKFACRKETVLKTWIVSGRGVFEINADDFRADEQSVFLVRKRSPVRIRAWAPLAFL